MTATLAQSASNISAGLWRGGTPFIDPMDLHATWWFTLIPLALFMSLAYKAVRAETTAPRPFFRYVLVMALQITIGMAALGAALHLFLAIVPRIA